MTEINKAYNFFEENLVSILNDMAPIRSSQPRKNPNNWISSSTKEMIRTRTNSGMKLGLPTTRNHGQITENYEIFAIPKLEKIDKIINANFMRKWKQMAI